MATSFELTPAQTAFLSRHIPHFDIRRWDITLAAQAGSDRRFVRIRSSTDATQSYILIVWDCNDSDWLRFMSVAQEVSATHSLLPSILATEASHGLILEEDLGDIRLKDYVLKCGSQSEIEQIYRRVIDALIVWHSHEIKPESSLTQRCMDMETFLWESSYFAQHCATEYFGLEKMLDTAWERERHSLASEAAALAHVCMHRDFQSENVLIDHERIRFVDFQGARLGPAQYDVAALLFDPYVPTLEAQMVVRLSDYYNSRTPNTMTPRGFSVAATQRLLQALGAFSNLSLHKGKDWYRDFIPIGLERLLSVLESGGSFPHITAIVTECIQSHGRLKRRT